MDKKTRQGFHEVAHLILFTIALTMVVLGLFGITFGGCKYDTGEERLTFGDGAGIIGEAYCERIVECAIIAPGDLEFCVAHEELHLCGDGDLDWDCELELTPEEEEKFIQCAVDLMDWGCGLVLPSSCYEVLEL